MCKFTHSFMYKISILSILIYLSYQEDSNKFQENIIKESITITEGTRFVDGFSLDLYNKHLPRNYSIRLEIMGKLAYINKFENLEKIIKKYEDVYNSKWVILIDNLDTWREVENYINNKRPINFLAFIWQDNLSLIDFFDQQYPVFISDPITFEVLCSYSIEREKTRGNFFINISYDNSPKIYPINYLYTLSISIAAISTVALFLWHVNTYKLNRRHTGTLQKILSALPYIKIVLSYLIIYYVIVAEEDNLYDNYSSLIRVYLDTIITTLESIFKTIFWFTFIMISCGWQIYRHNLTRAEVRRYVGVYLFIYLSVCFDQILDLMIRDPIVFNFEFSEVKNFVIYSLLTIVSIFKTKQSLSFIKHKYMYAALLAPDYLPSLSLKLKMLYLHISVVIGYTLVYFGCVTIQKTLFHTYSSQVLSLVHNNSLELLTLVVYLYIFRSRRLPIYFNMDNSSEELEESGNIYTCKLKSIQQLSMQSNSLNDFGFILNKNESVKEIKKNIYSNHPFVIVNPIFPEELGESCGKLNEQYKFTNEINRTNSLDSGVEMNHNYDHKISITDKISIGFLSQNSDNN